MFIDARTLAEAATVEADVCIIGGGAAGITLARDLAGSGRHVALFESGGFDFEDATQQLYDGAVVGHDMPPLIVERLRFLGGSTNHWSGGCRPFDALDFAARSYVPESGWPIGNTELDPYYRRAQAICQLGPYDYEPESWTVDAVRPIAFGPNARMRNGVFQYSPPTRFGQVYRADLDKAEGVRVYLHANVVDIETNEDASAVTGVRLASLDGRRFHASAKVYVLATGGIENARLLLNANSVQKPGLGNGNDLVGRYFMDHPYVPAAATVLLAHPDPSFAFYQQRTIRGTQVEGYVRATAETERAENLPSFGIGLQPGTLAAHGNARQSVKTIVDDIAAGHWPDHLTYHLGQILHSAEWVAMDKYRQWTHAEPAVYSTHYICECPPDRDSRVMLGDEVDPLGMRRVKVDWRLPADFERNMQRAHELLAQDLGRLGLGRLRMNTPETGRDALADLGIGYHHMGTTRMHADPRQGVVDANCRMHSIANLFIAGSSVFPNYSFDNPTMTIVALALRLSAHLKSLSLSAFNLTGGGR